jgi:nitrogen fixation/metabolism regulation signal transduction histidine kinase
MAQSNKRRSIPIVDKEFQYKYTAIIVAIVVVISAVLGYLLLHGYWEMNRIMDLAMESSEFSDKVNRDDALRVYYLSLLFIIFEVFAIGVLGLIITHRVCGPVIVIQRHLMSMLDGKYPPARPLRHGDEFQAAFNAFTAVLESLKKRDAEEVEKLNQVIAAARQKGVPAADVALLERLVAERRGRAGSN